MESLICDVCHAVTLIHVRSIENTFWCDVCKRWRPCEPPPVGAVDPQADSTGKPTTRDKDSSSVNDLALTPEDLAIVEQESKAGDA